jgi:PAS domain S-box-containing protein
MGTWSIDLATASVIVCERAARLIDLPRAGRYTAAEILVQIWPDDRGPVAASALRAIDPESDGIYEVEYRVANSDGRRWNRSWGRVTFEEREGGRRPISIRGAVEDRSERRRADQALRESEARFRAVTESLPQIVWCTDEGKTSYYVNSAWGRYFGRSGEDFEGNGWQEVIHPEDRERAVALWIKAMEGRSLFEVEYRLRRHDGAYRWFLARCVPVVTGETTRWFGTCTDIHDLKEAERTLREMDRAKDRFLAALSHELRNPLAPIRNCLFVLDRVPHDSDRGREALAMMGRQVQQLTRLVDDLLDTTRISHGKIEVRRHRLDLNELVRLTVADHRAAFTARGVGLVASPRPSPLFVHGDSARLAQSLGNLLQNAVRFTPPGGTTTISVAEVAGWCEIRVRDTGIGMRPELIEQLFEPFAQGEPVGDRMHEGLGLGLALVRGLIRAHGGDVTATSEGPDRGSEFLIRLPRSAEPEEDVAPPAPAPAPAASARGRVLVIDDNEDVAHSLADVLALLGHETIIALDGLDGIAKALSARPDLIFCDIGLPGIDGYEVAARIRADEALRDKTLVAITGYAQPADVERVKQSGFDHHMAKPLRMEALEALLAATLGPDS